MFLNIAHRGDSTRAPENTLASFEAAVDAQRLVHPNGPNGDTAGCITRYHVGWLWCRGTVNRHPRSHGLFLRGLARLLLGCLGLVPGGMQCGRWQLVCGDAGSKCAVKQGEGEVSCRHELIVGHCQVTDERAFFSLSVERPRLGQQTQVTSPQRRHERAFTRR